MGSLDHAITVGDMLWPVLAVAGIIGIGAALFCLLWLFNPFRSGH